MNGVGRREGRRGRSRGQVKPYGVAKCLPAARPVPQTVPVTTPAQLAAPTAQLTDRAVADLQLVLDGVLLPWPALGGCAADRSSGSVTGSAARVGVGALAEPVRSAAVAAGALVLTDREQTPIARLVDLDTGDTTALVGAVRPERARESRLFVDLAASPAELGPATPRHVVVVGRPLLQADLDRLTAAGVDDLLLLVPVEHATPDGVPPTTLMRSVLHVAAGLGQVKVVAVPLFWRDPESDRELAQAVADHYGATSTELVSGGSAWSDLLAALRTGADLPATAPEPVLEELRRWRPPPLRRGLVVLFTGLSGSGKSTLARDLAAYIAEWSPRTVSLLDGDDVRRLLSAGLGFDHAARDLNVRRIGYVASEVARHGGLAICAPIAPYAESRAAVRAMVEPVGDFVLVHVSTPLEECERRDLKGLYAKARAGLIPEFTGISDPYEAPDDADLVVDTSRVSRADALQRVLDLLGAGGWTSSPETPSRSAT
jgi:sulfate adenylyltransferase